MANDKRQLGLFDVPGLPAIKSVTGRASEEGSGSGVEMTSERPREQDEASSSSVGDVEEPWLNPWCYAHCTTEDPGTKMYEVRYERMTKYCYLCVAAVEEWRLRRDIREIKLYEPRRGTQWK